MSRDVLTKLRRIVSLAAIASFETASAFAQHIENEALDDPTSPFRLGPEQPDAVCSRITIKKHVEFCAELRLVTYHDAASFLPYKPLQFKGRKLDAAIERELWAYLEREGISKLKLRHAMRGTAIQNPDALWEALPTRNITRDAFRRCMYLLSQVSPALFVNRTWTYHLAEVA